VKKYSFYKTTEIRRSPRNLRLLATTSRFSPHGAFEESVLRERNEFW